MQTILLKISKQIPKDDFTIDISIGYKHKFLIFQFVVCTAWHARMTDNALRFI